MDAAWRSLPEKKRHRRHDRPKIGLTEINRYIAVQLALGNWPADMVWAGDLVLLALIDTYDSLVLYE